MLGGQHWRLAVLLQEAYRNATASLVRMRMLIVVAALLAAFSTVIVLSATRSAIDAEAELESLGSQVLVARSTRGIAPQACQGLLGLDGVRSTGGLILTAQWIFDPSSGQRFDVEFVSGQYLDIVSGTRSIDVDGLVAGQAAARELSLAEGSLLRRRGESGIREVSAIIDVETRRPSASRRLFLVGSPTDQLDECWVEFYRSVQPADRNAIRTALQIYADEPQQAVEIRPLLSPDTPGLVDPSSQLSAGTDGRQRFPIPVFALVYLILVWAQREQLAIYRVYGTSPLTLATFGAVEAGMIAGIGGACGALASLALAVLQDGLTISQIQYAAREYVLFVTSLIALGGAAWVVVGTRVSAQSLKS